MIIVTPLIMNTMRTMMRTVRWWQRWWWWHIVNMMTMMVMMNMCSFFISTLLIFLLSKNINTEIGWILEFSGFNIFTQWKCAFVISEHFLQVPGSDLEPLEMLWGFWQSLTSLEFTVTWETGRESGACHPAPGFAKLREASPGLAKLRQAWLDLTKLRQAHQAAPGPPNLNFS